MTTVRYDSVERAVADIRSGRAVVVVDAADRENEGDLIFAASKSTPALMAFLIRHSSGVVCAPVTGEMLDRLAIPLMTPHNRERMRTAYTISVDARDGVSTGISAADRSHTVRVLADSATEPRELVQPGHVFPKISRTRIVEPPIVTVVSNSQCRAFIECLPCLLCSRPAGGRWRVIARRTWR